MDKFCAVTECNEGYFKTTIEEDENIADVLAYKLLESMKKYMVITKEKRLDHPHTLMYKAEILFEKPMPPLKEARHRGALSPYYGSPKEQEWKNRIQGEWSIPSWKPLPVEKDKPIEKDKLILLLPEP